MEKFKVRFLPDNKAVEVERDKTILSAAISAGIYINSSCGGEGVCGRCKVILKSGEVLTQSAGRITAEEKKKGIHLACASCVHSDLEVEIPPESRLSLKANDYSRPEDIEMVKPDLGQDAFAYAPLTEKVYLEIPKPTLDDKVSDLDRLERSILKARNISLSHIGLGNIKSLGELLRSAQWQVTVTLGKRDELIEIIQIEAVDTAQRNFGFCFDIGTTTVSGQLVDLNSKKVLGTKATYNKQAVFGSDVITRIIYAKEQDGLDDLHQAVAQDINEMIRELAQEHGVDLNDVTCIVCAGNTTMIHLLLRVDPTYIRREPYVPTLNFVPVLRASDAEIIINPHGILSCVPGVASYVGGDVTAGILSSGLYNENRPCILIDIGTNGEVVLGNKDFLISAAASAGPAFEGSGVACGMRASKGAIQKVKISASDFEVVYDTIGGARPLGICGSGYIDIIAQMLKAGILEKDGKIKPLKNKRVRDGEGGKEFLVAGDDIVISEADIENLKRSKAAIYSAVSILVKHMGLKFTDIDKIFIAGGFGTYLDMQNAVRIGLLPDLDKSRFIFIGNSSLAGARQMILSLGAIEKAREIARMVTYFELSVEPGYMDEYVAALFFPHTDLTLFPNISV
jgi:uncharacterized 2Fe-2S/4Fe-4S cluster protein (DUF4445 family)